MPRSLQHRLLRSIGANVYGNSTTVVIQLMTVPILLHSWGAALYGSWLVLTAIPNYLTFSDLGFASVAGNEMTVLVARNDEPLARSVFQSAWLFVSLVSFSVSALGCVAVWLLPFEQWFGLAGTSSYEIRAIATLLFVYVLLIIQYGLVFAAFRSTGDYAVGAVFYSTARLFEACAVVGVAALGGRPLHAAIALVLTRVMMLLATSRELLRARSWLWFGWADANALTVRRLAAPALAFVAIPLATAMSLQGMVLIVGIALGPIAVVTFSALRTLSRVGISFMGVVNNAVWPEITTAFGRGDVSLARRLHRISCQAVVWLMIPGLLLLGLSGRMVVKFWTHGAVHFDGPLFYTLLGAVAVYTFWYTSSVVLLGATAHERMSLVVLVGSFASVIFAWILLQRISLIGAGVALILCDLTIAPYVLRQSIRLTGDRIPEFVRALAQPPPVRSLLSSGMKRLAFGN